MPMTPDDDFESPNDADQPIARPQGFSEMVRDNPVGAVIGAFVIGFLISRLI
jgi:hypothetical protein